MAEVLLSEKRNGILYLTLNRPEKRNALSVEVYGRLSDEWRRVDEDDEVKVVIFTGAGDKAFCAGMDLKEATKIKASTGKDILEVVKDPFFLDMKNVKKPIICAVNGLSMAGGFHLATYSDLRIAVDDAQFALREVKRGRGTPWAVCLLWMLPLAVALELTLVGEPLTAQRLWQLGFINKVVPREQLMPTATAMAEAICEGAPLSVMAAKESFYRAMDLGCEAGLKKAYEIYAPVYASEDAIEGPRAFAERRKPAWKGR
jgi:enoyl-CoA hydratase